MLDRPRRSASPCSPPPRPHFIHDGFSDVVYVLLPLWAAEFSLSFAQVGVIRTAYSGGMALFQIPAGLIAERMRRARACSSSARW